MDITVTWIIVLAAICACGTIAECYRIAPPIIFLLGGVLLGAIPDFPAPEIAPEYMLLVFLPPILMEAAFFTSIRDFKANLRPILLMSLGMVMFTACTTALAFHAIVPAGGIALGMLLGAIISPPDAAAATSALKHVRIPKRVSTILEGESLLNDATGLVLYKFALAAVLLGTFSWGGARLEFSWMAGLGALIGIVFSYGFVWIFPRVHELSVKIILTFIPPYAAFMLAEKLHASGVIAVVTAGLIVGWHAPKLFNSQFRVPAEIIWKMVVYFLNALAFMMIGIQLPHLLNGLKQYDNTLVITLVSTVCVLSVFTRFAYVYFCAWFSRLFPSVRNADPMPSWKNLFIISWTGMRGVVTLATALAIPTTLYSGGDFPYRDLIIFTAICVILFTLVLQGLSLPWVLRQLTLAADVHLLQEEWLARMQSAKKAMKKLEELASDSSIHLPALERIRSHYNERIESLGDGPNTPLYASDVPVLTNHPIIQAENRIWREILEIERNTIIQLRHSYTISDDVMHDLFREMDLLANRFHYEPDEATPSQAEQKRRAWYAFGKRRAA